MVMLVAFLIAVSKYLTRINLREEVLLTLDLRDQSIRVRKAWQQGCALVTVCLQLRNTESDGCWSSASFLLVC